MQISAPLNLRQQTLRLRSGSYFIYLRHAPFDFAQDRHARRWPAWQNAAAGSSQLPC